jgi:aspartate aminotransferase
MAAGGRDVVNLAVGEPDFASPESACDGAIASIRDGHHGYTPATGLPALKEAVAHHYAERRGLDIDPSQVVVTCGAKHALFNLCQVLLQEGDEALVPAPYWVSYPALVHMSGAEPVVVSTLEQKGFAWDVETLDRAVTERTRLVLLNSPSNPTGAVQDPEVLREVGQWASSRGLIVISDEIYEDLVYDGAAYESWWSDPQRVSDSVLVSGMSKSYAMTGWRIGWLVGNKEVVGAVSKLQSHSTSNPSAPAQYAALAALRAPKDYLEGWVQTFQSRRDLMVDGLRALDGVRLTVDPRGAFYAFPDVSGLLGRSFAGKQLAEVDDLCEALLEAEAVVAVPGTAFGAPNCLRLSYADSEERLTTALERLGRFIEGLD